MPPRDCHLERLEVPLPADVRRRWLVRSMCVMKLRSAGRAGRQGCGGSALLAGQCCSDRAAGTARTIPGGWMALRVQPPSTSGAVNGNKAGADACC